MSSPEDRNQLLRKLPSVDALLGLPDVETLAADLPRELVVEGVRRAVDKRRQELVLGHAESADLDAGDVSQAIEAWLSPTMRSVINASGVMLHTNLGRAPMPQAAAQRVAQVCTTYSNLEMDLSKGQRGSRMDLIREILLERTGAEDVLVVNNNAAAVYLALRALSAGREALVSRGELVEIGGSFRIPDVMSASGAILREVGTTNRTRLSDYERALSPESGLILKVHRSNFELVGFTEETGLEELAGLAAKAGLPLVMDMGAGLLLADLPAALMEFSVARVMAQGPELLCFSGDKLLGGPQAGILIGSRRLIGTLARDPMARALRVDKMTLAALEACLSAYRGGVEGARSIPVINMLMASADELRQRAQGLLKKIRERLPEAQAQLVECASRMGGGSMPLVDFPSFAVSIKPGQGGVEQLAERLRIGEPALVGRRQQESLWLDVRTLLGEEQLDQTASALAQAWR